MIGKVLKEMALNPQFQKKASELASNQEIKDTAKKLVGQIAQQVLKEPNKRKKSKSPKSKKYKKSKSPRHSNKNIWKCHLCKNEHMIQNPICSYGHKSHARCLKCKANWR
jgi:hypothetical protein